MTTSIGEGRRQPSRLLVGAHFCCHAQSATCGIDGSWIVQFSVYGGIVDPSRMVACLEYIPVHAICDVTVCVSLSLCDNRVRGCCCCCYFSKMSKGTQDIASHKKPFFYIHFFISCTIALPFSLYAVE